MTALRILHCHCTYARVIAPDVKAAVLAGLAESDVSFEAVPDLCELAARRDPALRELAGAEGLRIAACYPRAVRWLFSAAGAPLRDDAVVVNMRTESASAVVAALLEPRGQEVP